MLPAEGLEQAMRQALHAAGDGDWGTHPVDVWLFGAVAQHLSARSIAPSRIGVPRPGLVDAVRKSLHVNQARGDSLLPEMCATLLAKGLCVERRHYVHPAQAMTLSRLTSDEALILLAFARRNLAPITVQMELRYESLRNGLPVRHRDTVFDQGLTTLVTLSRPSMVGAYIANLERLHLIAAGQEELSPAEDPEHVRARDARGNAPVPMQTQFRRWLTGKDVNASNAEDMALHRPPAGRIGGIRVIAKTLSLRKDGRALVHAAVSRELVERARPRPR